MPTTTKFRLRFFLRILLHCFSCCLVSTLDNTWNIAEYDIIKCCSDGGSEGDGNGYYQLFKDTRRFIPDEETVRTLQYEPANLAIWNRSALNQYIAKGPVPLLKAASSGDWMDNAKDNSLLRIHAVFPETILTSIKNICGGCKNPSAVIWEGQILISTEIVYMELNYQSFFWLNSTGETFTLNHPNLFGISTSPEQYFGHNMSLRLKGTDCRMVRHPTTNHLHLFLFEWGQTLMSTIVMYAASSTTISNSISSSSSSSSSSTSISASLLNKEERQFMNYTKSIRIYPHEHSGFNEEKNWVPFVYLKNMSSSSEEEHDNTDNTAHQKDDDDDDAHIKLTDRVHIYVIQSIDPLHVVQVIPLATAAAAAASEERIYTTHTISKTFSKIVWPFTNQADSKGGDIRGGTNAVFVPHLNRYLAFFHSVGNIGQGYRTYFVGAYTFTAHAPFRVLSHSAVPVVHRGSMYPSGFLDKHTDYSPYPTSLFFDGDVLKLVYGAQNKWGWIADVDLDQLMASMVCCRTPDGVCAEKQLEEHLH